MARDGHGGGRRLRLQPIIVTNQLQDSPLFQIRLLSPFLWTSSSTHLVHFPPSTKWLHMFYVCFFSFFASAIILHYCDPLLQSRFLSRLAIQWVKKVRERKERWEKIVSTSAFLEESLLKEIIMSLLLFVAGDSFHSLSLSCYSSFLPLAG
jgi:hypothetical protein